MELLDFVEDLRKDYIEKLAEIMLIYLKQFIELIHKLFPLYPYATIIKIALFLFPHLFSGSYLYDAVYFASQNTINIMNSFLVRI